MYTKNIKNKYKQLNEHKGVVRKYSYKFLYIVMKVYVK